MQSRGKSCWEKCRKNGLICNKSNIFFFCYVRQQLVRSLLIRIYFRKMVFAYRSNRCSSFYNGFFNDYTLIGKPPKSWNANMMRTWNEWKIDSHLPLNIKYPKIIIGFFLCAHIWCTQNNNSNKIQPCSIFLVWMFFYAPLTNDFYRARKIESKPFPFDLDFFSWLLKNSRNENFAVENLNCSKSMEGSFLAVHSNQNRCICHLNFFVWFCFVFNLTQCASYRYHDQQKHFNISNLLHVAEQINSSLRDAMVYQWRSRNYQIRIQISNYAGRNLLK